MLRLSAGGLDWDCLGLLRSMFRPTAEFKRFSRSTIVSPAIWGVISNGPYTESPVWMAGFPGTRRWCNIRDSMRS